MTEEEKKEQPVTEKAEKKATAAKQPAKKKAVVEGKNLGVIGSIFMMCARPQGASAEEMLEHLGKTFKDRDPEGMSRTVGIQAGTRLEQQYGFEMKKVHDEKRGLVYRAPKGAFNEYLKQKGIALTDKEKTLLEKQAA